MGRAQWAGTAETNSSQGAARLHPSMPPTGTSLMAARGGSNRRDPAGGLARLLIRYDGFPAAKTSSWNPGKTLRTGSQAR